MPNHQIYLTSFYFTVTTITTVGYGDISGHTDSERIFCIIIMVAGVISFSLASGTLTSIIKNYDS
jgi:glutamate mutase epsilon subunit